jgi:hypothetical protein
MALSCLWGQAEIRMRGAELKGVDECIFKSYIREKLAETGDLEQQTGNKR